MQLLHVGLDRCACCLRRRPLRGSRVGGELLRVPDERSPRGGHVRLELRQVGLHRADWCTVRWCERGKGGEASCRERSNDDLLQSDSSDRMAYDPQSVTRPRRRAISGRNILTTR